MAVILRPTAAVLLFLVLLVWGKAKTEIYECPAGWDFESVCGENNCYQIVSIPPEKRERSIEDNFCAEFDKEAIPAVIRCEKENLLIPHLPRYNHIIQTTGVGIGFYVPANVTWGRDNFVNYDGSKVDFTKWGFINYVFGGNPEPGPGGEKATLYIASNGTHGNEYTWHDFPPSTILHLLCKRPAVLQQPKQSPAVTKNDQIGSYVCPAGFDMGRVCDGYFCYRVVSVPDAKRNRMIDDNYCAEFYKDAIPAIIRCKEENEYIVTLSDNIDIAEKNGFALGLYIPANKTWSPNNFVNYDGSKIEYLN